MLELYQHTELLAKSFLRLTGSPLISTDLKGEELYHSIYNAPFVVVSHGIEKDPIFNFANLKAQELWEMDWEEFTKTPSRLSAETISQVERQQLLERGREKGYISDYNGIRISKSGKRFQIIDTILWNLTDEDGNYRGQAAMFKEWKFV